MSKEKELKIKLTESELRILRTLLQDHLNTISDISSHYMTEEEQAIDYIIELERLENKLTYNLVNLCQNKTN